MASKREITCLSHKAPGLAPALGEVGHRWTLNILHAISEGVHHFDELRRTLSIAGNILTDRLKLLVENGILEREELKVDRRRVRYSLTLKGKALLPLLSELDKWGRHWCIASEAPRSSAG